MSNYSHQAPTPEHLAELLPKYGIERFIAQGGMGAVYKGRQISLDRDVAIKVLLYEFGDDAEFRESFTTEAKAMARLNHPNLLGVFDFGDVKGMPYIVMEYVDGGSLHEAAWNQAIDPLQAVGIVKGICYGLAHAHENGIVHRDIKPSNILLTLSADPKIADFGLAHAADSDKPGLVMGTPGYTAPEVFQDPSQAGQLADIYSVGVILHQLVTGLDPAGSTGPPTSPSGRLRLDAIWRKATHISPAQRYPSIAVFATELEKWTALQKNAPIPVRAAPYRHYKPPVQTNSSGGLLVKFLLIGILISVSFFTYQHLHEQEEEIKNGTAVIDATSIAQSTNQAPVKQTEPEPIGHTPDPKPTITVIGGTPNVPAIVDSKSEPVPDQHLTPGDPELRARAIDLILDARKKRDKAFSENARALGIRLDVNVRNDKPDEVSSIERLKEKIIGNRIPLTDDVQGLSDTLVRNIEQARSKEAMIVESYRADLTRIRDSYVSRLTAAAEATTDKELKRRLLVQVQQAKDLDTWIGLLSP